MSILRIFAAEYVLVCTVSIILGKAPTHVCVSI